MKHSVDRPLSSNKTMTEVDPARSNTMRAVRSRDTGPEIVVRRLAHCRSYRFRLHRKDLPGTPDLVFPKYRAVIFAQLSLCMAAFGMGIIVREAPELQKRTPNTGCESWNETRHAMQKPCQICGRPDGEYK